MPRSSSVPLGLLVALAAGFATAAPVLADHEPPRLGVTPVGKDGAYFELTMDPGETVELEVEVANFGHDEVLARTYAADAYPVANGGLGAELFGDEPSGTTLWVDYEAQELTLGPADALVIGFAVEVPEEATPGEYLTSIVVENAEPFGGSGDGDIRVQQINRSAIAVAIDVPGPRKPGLDIGSVGHHIAGEASVVTFELRNTGNVHLKPSGNFVLRDASETEIASARLELDSVYAGMTTRVEAPLASRLAPGDYCAELTLADEETRARDESECLAFTVEAPVENQPGIGGAFEGIPVLEPAIEAASQNPLLAVTVAAVALLLGAAAFALIRRRRQSHG